MKRGTGFYPVIGGRTVPAQVPPSGWRSRVPVAELADVQENVKVRASDG